MTKPKELTAEQIAAIDGYASKIVSMKNDIEAIQKLAGMYISGKGNLGYTTIFREIYQNAIDQVIDPESPGDYIRITFNEGTLEATVLDNGKGIPFTDMIRIFTKNHTSQNYTKEKGKYLTSVNGSGSKATNAFSKTFIVESYRYDGEARRMIFKNGYPAIKEPEKIPNKDKYQGTNIYFVPSLDLLGKITMTWNEIYELVRNIAALTPKGSVIDFTGIDKNGKEHFEHIVNTDGIDYFLVRMAKNPLAKPITVGDDTGEERAVISFTWDAWALKDDYSYNGERVAAYCNTCPIYDAGSTNITGTIKGITQWFQNYINNVYLANSRSKVRVVPVDIKEGLCVAIDSASIDPIFTGQAKQKLSNEEMDPFCKKVVMNGLDEWAKTNPNDLKKISEFIFSIAQVRTNADREKVKISSNYEQSAFGGGLPSSYKKPSGKDHIELWICEGLSALGALVQARDPVHQGLLPIRGKIISAFSNTPKKVFENEEIQSILAILFRKGKVMTPKECLSMTAADCKCERVILAVDGDVDGSHIASLLLRFFILYCPYLIEAGMVYKAMPPLYMVPKGKKKVYFLDNAAMAKENQKIFKKTYTIEDVSGKLSDRQVEDMIVRNADYVYELESAATNHGVTPRMLEIALMNRISNGSNKDLEKAIKKEYRFVTSSILKGVQKIEVSEDQLYTIYNSDSLFADCKKIIKIMKSNDRLSYKINGEDMTMYGIMKIFEGIMPSNIQRYKGLGEQDADELAESVTSTETRSLIRYTVQDVKEEIERIRRIESDRKLILNYTQNVNREDLIGI